ncbi:M23 family metallopeptidase [Paenibacillus sp. 481]|uniref:M23 family metallopeptidase n=1 Tax=Paenibacillus sp. 481 TaxID=2835869 RepID=UPI001E57DF97|nr:M23 family metallopeptidase [Paenibacillus sp. 481]UHA74214.1 M23 family metallopeptidase [Paenibacillus sp. 481]
MSVQQKTINSSRWGKLTLLTVIAVGGILGGLGENGGKKVQAHAPNGANDNIAVKLVNKEPNNPTHKPQNKQLSKQKQVTLTHELLGRWIAEHQVKQLYTSLSPDFKKQLSEAELQQSMPYLWKKGEKPSLLSATTLNKKSMYSWEDKHGRSAIQMYVVNNQITGLKRVTVEQYASDEQFGKTTYQLPFEDKWYVLWGGRNVNLSYHYEHQNQRYAYDIIMTKDGASYKGDPTRNESYYAFGKEVLAPADGVIVEVVNNVADNKPGELPNDPSNLAGNYVWIDHENGEYTLMAHFKKDSIKVKKGERVKAGQLLGLCGNSGNSSEAHIHMHLANEPNFLYSYSIRPQWENNLDPTKGQTLEGKDND